MKNRPIKLKNPPPEKTPGICINLPELIIQKFQSILDDILDHKHVHYILKGGRGSTKSSFISIAIILLVISNPKCHALVFRKVGNTIKGSTWGQIVWAIYQMGLEQYFHIPKTYSNPITYLPTGQQIIFFGLDDPDKVKSIKLPFGYIGITWFEELDQYSGDAEIRKVLQSTMRGGKLFWDFRSFNPPISVNNWANEYADLCESRDDCLVSSNTYLDVPNDWLGQPFIDEAEFLKKVNERAYKHEYLGIPVGTGGNVFYNVSDLDMRAPVEIETIDGVVSLPLYKTFSNIYSGIDWGFAVDPFRLIRMHYDTARRDLYIYCEYDNTLTRNENLFQDIYENKKILTVNDLVTADSAEPKSIADFKAYGAFIRGAEKGPDSVRYGIKWLQGLSHIYIDKRACPKTYTEFIQYEYDKDREGNWISAYPDFNNHSIDAVRYGLERFYKRKGN